MKNFDQRDLQEAHGMISHAINLLNRAKLHMSSLPDDLRSEYGAAVFGVNLFEQRMKEHLAGAPETAPIPTDSATPHSPGGQGPAPCLPPVPLAQVGLRAELDPVAAERSFSRNARRNLTRKVYARMGK